MIFGVTKVQARWRGATKLRELQPDGTIKKSNPSMKEKLWRLHSYECEATHDAIVNFRLDMAPKHDWASVCGAPAPGLDPNLFYRRLNAAKHGPDRTLFDVLRWWLVADIDDLKAPEGSNLGDPRHLEEAAGFARDQLPPELRDVTVVVAVSSSSGLDPTRISMHFYFLLPEAVLVSTIYAWLKGAKKAGYRIDPRVMLPAQLLLTGRPRFVGCVDPISRERRASCCRASICACLRSTGTVSASSWRSARRWSAPHAVSALRGAGARISINIWATVKTNSVSMSR